MSQPNVELTIVTPEERPLGIFGRAASDDLRRMLDEAGIALELSARAEIAGTGTVVLHPHGRAIEADRIIALPVTTPIHIAGLPQDRDGFTPVDAHGRVRGAEDVYAAGDGTSFPVKQGGLACQQADAAAATIAAAAGARVTPAPFRPVLRGKLMTGSKPLYMRNDISGTPGDDSSRSGHMLWWPPGKVAGAYLAPYLAAREEKGPSGTVEPPLRRSDAVPEHRGESDEIELLSASTR
jgi:sulfide:quinone oxidoreductase